MNEVRSPGIRASQRWARVGGDLCVRRHIWVTAESLWSVDRGSPHQPRQGRKFQADRRAEVKVQRQEILSRAPWELYEQRWGWEEATDQGGHRSGRGDRKSNWALERFSGGGEWVERSINDLLSMLPLPLVHSQSCLLYSLCPLPFSWYSQFSFKL